jgi:hypothetical protein
MIRVFLEYLIPFFLPLAVYLAWNAYRGRYAASHGGEAPRLEKGPWPMLLFAGALLTLAVMTVTALTGGSSNTGGLYVPARVEDGRVVPGHYESVPAKP